MGDGSTNPLTTRENAMNQGRLIWHRIYYKVLRQFWTASSQTPLHLRGKAVLWSDNNVLLASHSGGGALPFTM